MCVGRGFDRIASDLAEEGSGSVAPAVSCTSSMSTAAMRSGVGAVVWEAAADGDIWVDMLDCRPWQDVKASLATLGVRSPCG
jgi:hypothetical protein